MYRREVLALGAALFAGSAQAQIKDLNEAINKAGRQRMLSQRMGKAWLALVHGVETTEAKQVLKASSNLFESQLNDLLVFANNDTLRTTYQKLQLAWFDYKSVVSQGEPTLSRASQMLQNDAKVLSIAHQGTQQFEEALSKPVGKLVNIAGRQRMLSQRMAKFYFAAALPVDVDLAKSEIAKSRSEFLAAMEVLRSAPEATEVIRSELALADGQWVFFNLSLQRLDNKRTGYQQLHEVFTTSEAILSVMDRVTGLYANIKV
jgi:Type IV pili methyl-accepting chemotaxis transducer N-term